MNRGLARVVHSLSKPFTAALILASLALYILSIPVGMWLFVGEASLRPSSPPETQSLMYIYFILAELVYALCFVAAWKSEVSFRRSFYKFIKEPSALPLGNFLLVMPILLSLTHVTLSVVEYFQKCFQIPTGLPPLSPDPLLAYIELAWSPVFEEVVFRALPLGVFYAFYLSRDVGIQNVRRNLSVALVSFLSPERAKCMRSVSSPKPSRKIEADEWTIVIFSSALFALAHYLTPSTWEVGKLTLSFIQGTVMALSYVLYGLYASVLIHWYFNYYLYTYRLVAVSQPSLSFLSLFSEAIPTALTALTLTLLVVLKMKSFSSFLITLRRRNHQLYGMPRRFFTVLQKKSSHISVGRKASVELALLAVLTITLGLRLAVLEYPKHETPGGTAGWDLIFDEKYYVGAARDMLQGKAANNEHPPLAKVFIALGITLLGDNPAGWRASAISASSFSVALLYMLAMILSGRKDVSLCSAILFALDIMAFNIGQIALLDALAMAFVLASSISILRGSYDLGGLFLGLASLCKLSSAFTYFGIVVFLVLTAGRRKKSFKEVITSCLRSAVLALVVFLVGLWIYDSWYSVFAKNPLGQISYMLAYHSGLRYQDPRDVILPLQWINPLDPFAPMPFYVVTVKEFIGDILREYHPVAYYGIYTPLWWSVWAVVPLCLFCVIRGARKADHEEACLFTLTWIMTSFLPYVLLAYLMSRWVYPFYFYSALPGLYIGLSSLLNRRGKHHKVLEASVVFLQTFWFVLWFPVKPKVIIDLFALLGLPV
jgi:4-amino-4-deoxy-L-arabinose transferase-like glycosyltransferase